jgi:hypothetical protein
MNISDFESLEKTYHPVLSSTSSSKEAGRTFSDDDGFNQELSLAENLSSHSMYEPLGSDFEESENSGTDVLGDDTNSSGSENSCSRNSAESETLSFTDSEESVFSESDDCEITDSDLSDTEPQREIVSGHFTKDDINFMTDELKALKIVSCFRRHNLTVSASKDITETMKSIFHDSEHASILNYEYLMSFIGKYPILEVHYCEICTEVFPEDPNNYRCQNGNCEGYRFKGPLSKQQSKDRQPRKCFITADIGKQFTDLLQSPGNIVNLQLNKNAVPKMYGL